MGPIFSQLTVCRLEALALVDVGLSPRSLGLVAYTFLSWVSYREILI